MLEYKLTDKWHEIDPIIALLQQKAVERIQSFIFQMYFDLLVLQRCFWGKRILPSVNLGNTFAITCLESHKQNCYSKISEQSWGKETFWLEFPKPSWTQNPSFYKVLLTKFLGIHVSKSPLIPSIYFIEDWNPETK